MNKRENLAKEFLYTTIGGKKPKINKDLLVDLFSLVDFNRQLLKKEINGNFVKFLQDQTTMKLFCETIFDPSKKSFASSVETKFISKYEALDHIVLKNEFILVKLSDNINKITDYANSITGPKEIFTLKATRMLLKHYFRIFRKMDGYYQSYIDKIFENLKESAQNKEACNHPNYIVNEFLLDFLTSKIEKFTLTHNDFESIIIKDQRLNRDSIYFVRALHDSKKKLKFPLDDYIHMHFITFLTNMLSPDISISHSLLILEFLVDEIKNNIHDKFVRQILNANYQHLPNIIKTRVVELFELIPSNYYEVITDDNQYTLLGIAIIQVLSKKGKLIEMIEKGKLADMLAKRVEELLISKNPNDPRLMQILKLLPKEYYMSEVKDVLYKYNGGLMAVRTTPGREANSCPVKRSTVKSRIF